MNFTNEIDDACGRRAVFMVDIHDDRHLFLDPVSLDESLGHCGCSKEDCGDIESYINKYREKNGDKPLDGGTIKPKTTIRELIGYVC